MRRSLLIVLYFAAFSLLFAGIYLPDRLGDGYVSRVVDQPDDYSGEVISTIIKKDTVVPGGKGVIYIHGYNDYFFQAPLGDSIVSHGWNFKAVDLRKYGRSLRDGQNRYEARSLREYFPDIDSAVIEYTRQGVDTIVLMGHSTGGLISALYMDRSDYPHQIKGLILNSPFLSWRMGWFMREVVIPAVSVVGMVFPNIKIDQGSTGVYAHSLLAEWDGEWNYDTTLKLTLSPPVTAGWINAIERGQRKLRSGKDEISVPVLLMHSDLTADAKDAMKGDTVLDVEDIARYGRELGPDVTEVTVPGGLHDLILSPRESRDIAYHAVFCFLEQWP